MCNCHMGTINLFLAKYHQISTKTISVLQVPKEKIIKKKMNYPKRDIHGHEGITSLHKLHIH